MDHIFDSHAHYDDKAFDKDREDLLSGLKDNGVDKVVNISARIDEIEGIIRLSDKYGFMYMSTGVHPTETYDLATKKCVVKSLPAFNDGFVAKEADKGSANQKEGDEASFESLDTEDAVIKYIEDSTAYHKVRAVGEIGLDYHYDDTDKNCQQKWFSLQLEIAKKKRLPIVVHSREAAADTLMMIKESKARDVGGVIHCFSYEYEMAKQYMDMGFFIGVGGVVTFKNARKLKEIVEYMPMDMMLLETDCPYLAPVPHRGERNDSSMLRYVVDEIAAIKGMGADDVRHITNENACRLYNIS